MPQLFRAAAAFCCGVNPPALLSLRISLYFLTVFYEIDELFIN